MKTEPQLLLAGQIKCSNHAVRVGADGVNPICQIWFHQCSTSELNFASSNQGLRCVLDRGGKDKMPGVMCASEASNLPPPGRGGNFLKNGPL